MRPVSIEENSPTSIMNHHISCFTAGYWVPIMRFYCKLFVLLLDCTYHYGYRWYISCFITSIERTAYRIFQVQVKEFGNNAVRCSTVLHTELHYSDVIISSQITGVSIGYWNRLFVWNQRKHQSSASLAFVRGVYLWPVNSPHKGPVTQKMFPFVITETYTDLQKFDITLVSWSARGNTATQMTIFFSRISHRIFWNFVWEMLDIW